MVNLKAKKTFKCLRGGVEIMRKTSYSERGFTLVELLIVIVIIGILAGILISVINPAQQQRKARDGVLVATLNKIVLEIKSFANSDVSGVGNYPNCTQLGLALGNYVTVNCNVAGGTSTFNITGVNGATAGTPAVFTYTWTGSTAFCLSVPLATNAADFMMITQANAAPTKGAAGCP